MESRLHSIAGDISRKYRTRLNEDCLEKRQHPEELRNRI